MLSVHKFRKISRVSLFDEFDKIIPENTYSFSFKFFGSEIPYTQSNSHYPGPLIQSRKINTENPNPLIRLTL